LETLYFVVFKVIVNLAVLFTCYFSKCNLFAGPTSDLMLLQNKDERSQPGLLFPSLKLDKICMLHISWTRRSSAIQNIFVHIWKLECDHFSMNLSSRFKIWQNKCFVMNKLCVRIKWCNFVFRFSSTTHSLKIRRGAWKNNKLLLFVFVATELPSNHWQQIKGM
jgi:hypothetical protein